MDIRSLILVLLISCLLSCSPTQYSSPVISSHELKISQIDPQDPTFPGGRGGDELVLYTPEFGNKTGTNIYGIEAVIENGIVTSVGGNDQVIPKNGWVISGHGSASRWISAHLSIGIEIEIRDSLLWAHTTVESRLQAAATLCSSPTQWLDTLDWELAHLSKNQLDHFKQQALTFTQEARTAYSQGKDSVSIAFSDSALRAAKDYYYSSFPAREDEIRAVWLAMQESSPRELRESVRAIAEAGFNTICPQIIFGGYTAYPGAPGLQQNPQLAGWDPMAELVSLCKEHQLQLIPWVWVYFIGREGSPLIQGKKAWLGKSRKGDYASEMEVGYHFFCQSRSEVRAFWLNVYQDLIRRYAFDGLQLDYIRYAVSEPFEKGYCYCDFCRNQFKNEYGHDPLALDPTEDSLVWQQWNAYRVANVNGFVGEVFDLLQNKAPHLRLSSAIFPDAKSTLALKMQDWPGWMESGNIHDIFTMTYTADPAEVTRTTQYLMSEILKGGHTGIVGLAPYMGLSSELLLTEIFLAQQAGADGICFFHAGSFTEEHKRALELGPFRVRADLSDWYSFPRMYENSTP